MCLWNTDAPAATKSKYGQKKSYILTPPHPQGAWDVSEVWGTLT